MSVVYLRLCCRFAICRHFDTLLSFWYALLISIANHHVQLAGTSGNVTLARLWGFGPDADGLPMMPPKVEGSPTHNKVLKRHITVLVEVVTFASRSIQEAS